MFCIDFHSHILPNIDDGSKSIEQTLTMLDMLCDQGVRTVAATPHFRAHRDTVEGFLAGREEALEKVKPHLNGAVSIKLGAEVAIEHGISELERLPELAYENTNYILLEFPYRPFSRWMQEEIESVFYERGLIPVIAHIDRYAEIFSQDAYDSIFSMQNLMFQINNEAFKNRRGKNVVKYMIKNYLPFVLGSDCHNTEERKPNFDLSKSGLKRYDAQPEAIELINSLEG